MKRETLIRTGYACRRRENAIITFLNAVVVIGATAFILYHAFFVWV